MLSVLKIEDLALVESLLWEPGEGLVAVTGETGAGKSVIVGALQLVLGGRTDKSIIRTGEKACTVEAVFEVADVESVGALLEEAGIDGVDDGQVLIKRVITASGSRQYINHSPTTLSFLRKLGVGLVDLHGPHDHQSLLDTSRQLAMLDAYAGVQKERDLYVKQWRVWREKMRTLDELVNDERAGRQEVDLLKFQVEEIDAAELVAGEEDEVEERYQRASNSRRLVELSSQAGGQLMEGEHSVMGMLAEVQKLVNELEQLDPSLSEAVRGVEGAALELEEFGSFLQEYAGGLEMNPEEAKSLEVRMDTLESLKRKYGATVEEVITHRDEAFERLHAIENREELVETLTAERDAARGMLNDLGLKLGKKRMKFAKSLARDIGKHLKDLGFKQAAFEITLTKTEEPKVDGFEEMEFEFGPNPGEPLQPLRKIGSSGEISRVMLAVKSSLSGQDAIPLMVFDEIDANVGGGIARAVGEKMARLGDGHQVVAVTHFPQVAAVAQQHFVVEKELKKGRTVSCLNEVTEEGRVDELVRMLGGGQGDEARAMARSFLVID